MQFSSLERLQHLAAIRSARNATVRDASDNCADLRARLQRAEGRRRHLNEIFHPREAADGLKSIEAKIETLRAELSDADARRSEAAAAFQAAGACHDAARRFAHEQGLPMPSEDAREVGERRGLPPRPGREMKMLGKLKSARNSASKAADDARRSVDELRALRVRLFDERDDVASRPRPLAEAQDAAAAAVLRAAEQALADVSLRGLMRPGDNRGPRLDLTGEQAGALALAASVEGITELISARLSQAYEGQSEPMSATEQADELKRIDDEILAAELAEEGTIRALEGAGLEVARRSDADPRALLAHDRELR